MQRQIYKAISFAVGAAVLVFGIIASLICYNYYQGFVKGDMRHACDLLIQEQLQPQELYERLSEALDYNVRVTFISETGDVIYDSSEDVKENHINRKEVAEALINGKGDAARHSVTANTFMYYYAVKYQDGIIRFAREYSGAMQILLLMFAVMFVIGGATVLISSVLSVNVSRRLVEPINQLAKQLETVDIPGAEPIRLRNDCIELTPVVSRIEAMYDNMILQLEAVQKTARIRREFSANVSHELKTPLTTIKGFGEMLASGIISDGEEVKRYGGTIFRESERLLGLINDIIKISEVEEGTQKTLPFSEADIYNIAEESVKCLEVQAQKHDVKVFLEGSECKMWVQERYMMEMILNLIDNAIKYNKPGGTVWVQINEVPDGCQIKVRDNGIGIPIEHQQRIFERFYRVDKSRSKLTGGTGLGLAIVKHIAALHHGTISVFSRPGEGTEITVKLPREKNENK